MGPPAGPRPGAAITCRDGQERWHLLAARLLARWRAARGTRSPHEDRSRAQRGAPPRKDKNHKDAELHRSHHPTRLIDALCVLFMVGLVAGCGGSAPAADPQSIAAAIERIEATPPSAITPEQVAEAFALGSRATDLQRDLLERDLIDSVVEWDLKVYEVAFADGFYKVTSQAIPIEAGDALQLLRVAAFVQAQDAADEGLLRSVRTDDVIRIRGIVREIQLRTVLVVWPGVVVGVRRTAGYWQNAQKRERENIGDTRLKPATNHRDHRGCAVCSVCDDLGGDVASRAPDRIRGSTPVIGRKGTGGRGSARRSRSPIRVTRSERTSDNRCAPRT